jgi:hypothetical protein
LLSNSCIGSDICCSIAAPPLLWQVHPTLTASHFKFQGDNYRFGVPLNEITRKLRLSKSFGVFSGATVYIDYTDHTSDIDVYIFDQLVFGSSLGNKGVTMWASWAVFIPITSVSIPMLRNYGVS